MRFSDLYPDVASFVSAMGLPGCGPTAVRVYEVANAVAVWEPPTEAERRAITEKLLGLPLQLLAGGMGPQGPLERARRAAASQAAARSALRQRLWEAVADPKRTPIDRRAAFVVSSLLTAWFARPPRWKEKASDRYLKGLHELALDPCFAPVAGYFLYALGHSGSPTTPGPAAMAGFTEALGKAGIAVVPASKPGPKLKRDSPAAKMADHLLADRGQVVYYHELAGIAGVAYEYVSKNLPAIERRVAGLKRGSDETGAWLMAPPTGSTR